MSNRGDHILDKLAVKAGAEWGTEVTEVVEELHESTIEGHYAIEVWTRFEVLDYDGTPSTHYLAGPLDQAILRLVAEETTVPVKRV